MKKTLALLLALVMVFALAACSNDSGDANTTPSDDTVTTTPDETTPDTTEPDTNEEEPVELTGEPIKIGHIADLTGVEAMTGEQAVQGLDFAVKLIEANGGIAGRPIEIIVGDAQSNAATAADVARKLVENDGVVAILGPTQVGHKGTVAEYVQEAGIPAIYYNGTPAYMLANNDWVIGAGGATPQMPTAMADYVYNELGFRKVHVLSMDNTGYKSYLTPFMENFTAMGGEVLSEQWAPIPCNDWALYLSGLSDADAIISWASGSDAISLWQAWYDLGISDKMPIIGVMHGGFTDYFIGNALTNANPGAAEAFEGTYAPILYTYSNDTPENNAFVEAWTEEFGSVPGGTNMPGATYQALLLLKTAIESIDGNTEPEALRDALLSVEVTGPEGHLYFEEGSHLATKDVHIVQVVKLDDGSYNYEIVKTYNDVPPSGLTVG